MKVIFHPSSLNQWGRGQRPGQPGCYGNQPALPARDLRSVSPSSGCQAHHPHPPFLHLGRGSFQQVPKEKQRGPAGQPQTGASRGRQARLMAQPPPHTEDCDKSHFPLWEAPSQVPWRRGQREETRPSRLALLQLLGGIECQLPRSLAGRSAPQNHPETPRSCWQTREKTGLTPQAHQGDFTAGGQDITRSGETQQVSAWLGNRDSNNPCPSNRLHTPGTRGPHQMVT